MLKAATPHPESEHEADALRLWRGCGAVRLLGRDAAIDALLLERCRPGRALPAHVDVAPCLLAS